MVAPTRSLPASAPHEPMYRLKNEQISTRSPGRMPMPHRTRAWASPIRVQSSAPMPNTVGRPVVPLVPWMRATASAGTQR